MGIESFDGSKQQKNTTISEAKDFDELYEILNQIGELRGTKKSYTTPELKDIIERVREGILDPEYVTRTSGLRGKVEELLNIKSGESSDDNFNAFYNDPVAADTLERVSLEYLKTQDEVYFYGQYTGELDSDGFLIRKDGRKPLEKPSMNISEGKAMQWVIEKVKAELNQ